MKLIYEIEGDRATQCYYLHDDGTRQYVDYWHLKTDCEGWVFEVKSWKPFNIRKKNYSVLREKRGIPK